MSQEDWVHKKRSERPQEFAPPTSYQPDFVPNPAALLPEKPKQTLFFSSKKSHNTMRNTADKGTTRSNVKTEECVEDLTVFRRAAQIQPPASFRDIRSSPGDTNKAWGCRSHSTDVGDGEQAEHGKGAEIPPPATFEYYGPSFSRAGQKQGNPRMSDLESSITAGLRYLRQQAEERENQREKGLLDII
jgi:hypothetical protein